MIIFYIRTNAATATETPQQSFPDRQETFKQSNKQTNNNTNKEHIICLFC